MSANVITEDTVQTGRKLYLVTIKAYTNELKIVIDQGQLATQRRDILEKLARSAENRNRGIFVTQLRGLKKMGLRIDIPESLLAEVQATPTLNERNAKMTSRFI